VIPAAGGLLDLPAAIVAGADGALAFIPPVPRVLLWGLACGAAAMGLYALVSPQRRLAELSSQARAARAAVRAYDGAFSGALPLLSRQISLSLRHTGLTLLPTLAAALPVLLAATGLAARFGDTPLLGGTPRWLGGWEAPFLLGAFASSLAMKLGLRIH
jgi:hypothetical protein